MTSCIGAILRRSQQFNVASFKARGALAVITRVPIYTPKLKFHTSVCMMSRRTGSKALEPEYREASKKQVRRKLRHIRREALKIDPKKERLKKAYMKEQFESEDLKNYIKDLSEKLYMPTREIMLPDNIQPKLQKTQANISLSKIDPEVAIRQLTSIKLAAKASPLIECIDKQLIAPQLPVTNDTNNLTIVENRNNFVNQSLLYLTHGKNFSKVMQLYDLMKCTNVPVASDVLPSLIRAATDAKKFDVADTIFNEYVASDSISESPNMITWTAKVNNIAKSGKPDAALAVMEQLIKLELTPTPIMYTVILRAYIDTMQLDKAYSFWLRMHDDNVAINTEAFSLMLKYCAAKHEAERAFFYMDEMAAHDLEPDHSTFIKLFNAVATAPHWVRGYEDIIFDAMAIMEGKEMAPVTGTYVALINAFAKARDPVAAEYYFWEMQRKGLPATTKVYEALLSAYARAQNVGASKYGTKGRYGRPTDNPPTTSEQAKIDIGPERVAKLMSSGVTMEYDYQHGKRTKAVMHDMLNDDQNDEQNQRQYLMNAVYREATALRRAKLEKVKSSSPFMRGAKHLTITDDDVNSSELKNHNSSTSSSDWNSDSEIDGDDDDDDDDDEDFDTWSQSILKEKDATGRKDDEDESMRQFLDIMNGDDDILVDGQPIKNKTTTTLTKGEQQWQKQEKQVAAIIKGVKQEKEFDSDYEEYEHVREMSLRAASIAAGVDCHEALKKELLTSREFRDPFVLANIPELQGRIITSQRQQQNQIVDNTRVVQNRINRRSAAIGPVSLLDGNRDAELSNIVTDKASTFLVDNNNDVEQKIVTNDELDASWDMVYFGRAPNPDYSAPLNVRRQQNVQRAELCFRHFLKMNTTTTEEATEKPAGDSDNSKKKAAGASDNGLMRPTLCMMDTLLAVHTEALRADNAIAVLESYQQYNLTPGKSTYDHLMRMYTKLGDIKEAMRLMNEMRSKQLKPDPTTYGIMIESTVHRNMIVESLQLLEQATELKVGIPERNMRILRSRCASLGVKHPCMPADPHEWVKDVKELRRRNKNTSQREVEPIRSIVQ